MLWKKVEKEIQEFHKNQGLGKDPVAALYDERRKSYSLFSPLLSEEEIEFLRPYIFAYDRFPESPEDSPIPSYNFIDGVWQKPSKGSFATLYHHADKRIPLISVADSDEEDCKKAIDSLERYWKSLEWVEEDLNYRKWVVKNVSRILHYFYEECIREIREQIPKTRLEADKDFWEGKRAADHLEGAAEIALQGEVFPLMIPGHSYWNSYIPGGICAIITPMNFIYGIPWIQILGCYLSGSPFVFKGHPFAGITNSTLIRILLAAGANPRAIAKIEGFGKKVSSLAGDERVAIVSVTGSSFTAEAIRAMRGLRTLHFEGGGCNWAFVDEGYTDEEYRRIAERLVYAKLGLSSHKCTTLHGIAATRPVLEKLLPLLKEEIGQWKIMDPRKTEEPKIIGPAMVHKAITSTRIQEAARKAGLTIHLEGGKVTGDDYSDHAEVVAPIIIGGVRPDTEITVDWDDKGERTFRLATTELFAPILILMEIQDFDEFIRFSLFENEHDLAVSIYTKDERKLYRARLTLGGMLKEQDGTDSALEWESFGASGVGPSGNMGVGYAISTIRLFCRKQKGRHVIM